MSHFSMGYFRETEVLDQNHKIFHYQVLLAHRKAFCQECRNETTNFSLLHKGKFLSLRLHEFPLRQTSLSIEECFLRHVQFQLLGLLQKQYCIFSWDQVLMFQLKT